MSHRRVIDRYLTQIPLFSACSRRDLRQLSGLASYVTVPAGTVLARQGEPGHELVLIMDGTVSVEIDGERVATLGPGDFFGEVSLLDGGPRTATVTAETELTVEVIAHREFHAMLQQAPTVAIAMLVGVATRLRRADALRVHRSTTCSPR